MARTLIINNLSSRHSPSSNCEVDDNCCLPAAYRVFLDSDHVSNREVFYEEVDEEPFFFQDVTLYSKTANAYVAGYCIKKLINSVQDCHICAIELLENPIGKDEASWIEYKDYTGNSLKVPGTTFFDLFRKCCQVLDHFIQALCTADNIKLKLLETLEKIRSDDTKYTAVLKALDFETLRLIQDVLRNPPMTGKYEYIKSTILSRMSESRGKQIDKLLKNLTLGEKKPSQLLREMLNLAKGEVSEDIIIKLWSERLPHHIRPQLIVSRHLGPEALAEVADILVDHCSPTSHVMSTTHKSSVEQRLDRHETLLMSCVQKIKELRAMLNTEREKNDQQESQLNNSRSRSEQLNQSSSRSGSRHRSRTPSRGSVCYYHYRYGEKATKYSGSVISILPAQKFANGHSKEELVLFAANSSRISTYGKRTLELDLSLRRSFSWQFVVADVATAIIGADFLSNYNLLIDLKGRRLIDSTTGLTSDGKVLKAQQVNISTVNPAEPFKDLLAQYIAITKPQVTTNNKSSLFAHRITTTGSPLASRFRKIFGEKAVAARSEIQDLLNRGILRPSNSPWASPIHMVPKKNGTFRMCGDYRRLNANTLPDRYPPPLIMVKFNNLHQKAVFSTIDLEKAYHQVPMHEEDIQKTAIITPWGLFEYLRMPFGLKNAAQTFQRFINHIFQDFNFVFIYIDDILVMSTDMNEHRRHLQLVFERLQEYSLTINLEKCAFGKDEVNFLGYKLSAAGYSPSPDRVEKIINYPKPLTVIELRRFLGMVNYYRKSIPKAANIQAPLYEYVKSSVKNDKTKIVWNDTSLSAFSQLKEALANATLLHFPSSIANINLITDASTTAIGATLEQELNGAWHPIGFFSRKLSSTEQRYSTYDRELLAIFASIKFFEHLLEGRHFCIKTDHKPITYVFQQKLEKASDRQRRQLEYISQYSTDIVYMKGDQNVVADALSRINAIQMPSKLTSEEISQEQNKDVEMQTLLNGNTSIFCLVKKFTIPPNSSFVSFDVISLFTNIPWDLALEAVSDRWTVGSAHTSIDLAKILCLDDILIKAQAYKKEERDTLEKHKTTSWRGFVTSVGNEDP
ncbi:uncharacterized protein LOC113382069 [Ctenocephalides felis]|uniref:uncharacterized protein LOC113382069 n=1 Tax=Ctenocephalides felis TaxID=7515 RepID=UPI000E6E1AB2|nr:uncharacterized protein LOC113382069 [Ctenocephalides felis]